MRTIFVLLIIILLVLQYTLWFGKGGIRDVNLLQAQLTEQSAEIDLLKERNQSLAAEVLDLKQGMDAIEELARSEIGMIKEGELFFQILRPEQQADSPEPETP